MTKSTRLNGDRIRRSVADALPGRRVLTIAVCIAFLAGCSTLPSLDGRTQSAAFIDTGETRLGRATAILTSERAGQSGLLRLVNGRDAFAARVRLADASERSLDVQYYIWKNDLTGTLLLGALRRAADRGVRVRLLLDDHGTRDLDDRIAAIGAHQNIEVRFFNPFKTRRWRGIESVVGFARLNRRMHNKSFTADNQVTILGGRNIGDAYFDAGTDIGFVDLDVLAIGPVVADVSRDFDRYWASEWSYPAKQLIAVAPSYLIEKTTADAARIERSAAAAAYEIAVAEQPLVRKMVERDITFEWAVTHLVSDDPAKITGAANEDTFMWAGLTRVMKPPTSELALVSAYFVPGDSGVKYLADLARSGVKVSVLTNALEATDVAAVHSGYAKWRRSMLEAGVRLWEMKRSANARSIQASRSDGSSGSSLHTKTFEVDRTQVFIGSSNFDPRSRRLNTELGFVIDSPSMATDISETISDRLAERAYRLRLSPTGSIHWIEVVQGGEIVHDTEPGTTFWQRLGVGVLSVLPIEWLL